MEVQQIDQQEQLHSQEIVDEKERVDRLKAEEARKVQALQVDACASPRTTKPDQ